jgi:hypothetical protein
MKIELKRAPDLVRVLPSISTRRVARGSARSSLRARAEREGRHLCFCVLTSSLPPLLPTSPTPQKQPASIKPVVEAITAAPLDCLAPALRGFRWEYDKVRRLFAVCLPRTQRALLATDAWWLLSYP